jgi:GNAT superfamily N-acetyltransferase
MVQILDFLGKPTRQGFTFRQEGVDDKTNELLKLSKAAYSELLYQTVIHFMDICDANMDPLPQDIKDALLNGEIPTKDEFELRSRDFEEGIGDSVVILYNPDGNLGGLRVHMAPKDNYHYRSEARDKHGDPKIEVIHRWPMQAHCWEMAFYPEFRRQGFGTFAYIAAVRLSEQEGARNITTYTSTESEGLASKFFAERMEREVGLEYHGKFPTFGPDGNEINNGRLWRLPLESPRVQEGLKRLEERAVGALF